MNRSLVLCAGIALLGLAAQAAVIPINSEPSDNSIGLNASAEPILSYTAQTTLIVGDDNFAYNKGDNCAVVVFALPDLGGETISAASLSVDLYTGYPGGVNDWPKSLNLYGVRYGSSSAVLTSDFAPVSADPGNGTLIQLGIFTMPSSGVYAWDSYETDAAGDAALAAWIADQYAAGAQAGDYVFLRFNLDKPTANSVQIASANSVDHNIPVLTITTIPEPATLGLLALGALTALRRRA